MAEMMNTTRRSMMGGAAALAAVVAMPVMASEHADAELLRLGRELERAWANERAITAAFHGVYDDDANNLVDDVCDASGRIVDQIRKVTATTPSGLRVKARAICWIRGEEEIQSVEADSIDARMVAGLLRDLLNMRGVA